MLNIVVVTHNRLEYTKQCIQAILDNTDVKSELIIVDSGSTDKTGLWLRQLVSSFETKINGVYCIMVHELGYNSCADAYNWGFSHSQYPFVVRIDNDVIVPEYWASTMYHQMVINPEYGMLTTDLITDMSKDNPSCSDICHISPFNGIVWHNGGLGSWCMGMRGEMFEQVGMYRPLFGPYALQDNDLEKRAKNAGWLIGTISGLAVGHLYSMETSEESEYNHWKQGEYHNQISAWENEWGQTP
jgi:GT2 family glycosyltransferase